MNNQPNTLSELRQDMVSGDWVVIATGRARRPHDFLQEKRESFLQPKTTCPFEEFFETAHVAYQRNGKNATHEDWWVQALPNKYPAFSQGQCGISYEKGPYHWIEGAGLHDVIVTRDHERSFAQMSQEEADLVIRIYQERYRDMQREDPCIRYVSIFHNHGYLAGATLAHPHSQMIGIPVIPPDIGRSLEGATRYYEKNKSCVHCAMIVYEAKAGERVVFENKDVIVVAPYASRAAFELRIFPKKHQARFEEMDEDMSGPCAEALRITLAKLFKGLGNPDYNFFIHTAPRGNKASYAYYHWHLEILPKTAIWAGFEIGTGIEIATIGPEDAALFLRDIKV